MPRLHRPYIPLSVRVQVAERQMLAATGCYCTDEFGVPAPQSRMTLGRRLSMALWHISGGGIKKMALDHDPALVNRKRYVRNGKTFYQPPANDPNHLVYREAGRGSDHDIKTRVRGDGAKRSDLAQARYNKRVAKNRATAKASGFPKSRSQLKRSADSRKTGRVYHWGSRPLRSKSAGTWPSCWPMLSGRARRLRTKSGEMNGANRSRRNAANPNE